MTVTVGYRLGPYEILAPLGRGGMGEVYRARDTRLGRTVAIKLLPPDAAGDPEARQRLLREARAISALDHPHICALYDVGHVDGVDYLVMQHLEGETLAQRLKRGPLPAKDAVTYGMQMADALDAAHRRGIVHRDLKPANVMVTENGVRLLDFGIAKLRTALRAGETTRSVVDKTAAGVLIGTLPYMAPEHLDGREVDARSDVFALGAVLHELLTGHRLFDGDGPATIMSAVMTHEPPPISSVQPLAPPHLDHVVAKCLEKRPEDRWQSARDVSTELAFAATRAAMPVVDGQERKTPWLWLGGATALAAVAFFMVLAPWFRSSEDTRAITQPMQFDIQLPSSVREISGLTLSPDGSRVAFTSADRLWIHDLGTRETQAVAGVTRAGGRLFPFWSFDSQSLAFFQNRQLMRIPRAGGIPQRICDVESQRGGSWGANDTIVFADQGGLFSVAAGGGIPSRVTTPDQRQAGTLRFPHFLPDGRRFTYVTSFTPDAVYIGSLDPNEPYRKVATLVRESEAYAVSGFLLTAVDYTLRAHRLGPDERSTVGEAVPIARETKWYGFHGYRAFAVSPNVLVYSAEKLRRFQFTSVNMEGKTPAPSGQPVLVADTWSLAPNGATVAFSQWNAETRRRRIVLLDLASGRMSAFTSDTGDDYHPVWNRLNDQIVFTREVRATQGNPAYSQDLHLKRLGTDRETLIGRSSSDAKYAANWHSDGQTLLYNIFRNIWTLRTDGDHQPVRWLDSDATLGDAQFSPDSRWVAYVSNESGRNAVYVRRYPEADAKEQVSTTVGVLPRWRKDGRALYYIADGTLIEAELQIGPTIKVGRTRPLFELKDSNGYAVLPDDRGFVLCRLVDPVVPPTITVVLNWAASLPRP